MNTEFKVTSNLHGLARRLIAEGILDATAAEARTVGTGQRGGRRLPHRQAQGIATWPQRDQLLGAEVDAVALWESSGG